MMLDVRKPHSRRTCPDHAIGRGYCRRCRKHHAACERAKRLKRKQIFAGLYVRGQLAEAA